MPQKLVNSFIVFSIGITVLVLIFAAGMWDNNSRREEAIRNATKQREEHRDQILKRIDEVSGRTQDRFHRSDMSAWLGELKKQNPDVKVPELKKERE